MCSHDGGRGGRGGCRCHHTWDRPNWGTTEGVAGAASPEWPTAEDPRSALWRSAGSRHACRAHPAPPATAGTPPPPSTTSTEAKTSWPWFQGVVDITPKKRTTVDLVVCCFPLNAKATSPQMISQTAREVNERNELNAK